MIYKEQGGYLCNRPVFVMFFMGGTAMAENNVNLQATFIYIKYEIGRIAEKMNLTAEQVRDWENRVKQQLGITE